MARLQHDHDAVVEKFHATSGRATGWMTVILAAVEEMAGRQVLAVRAGERRWVSTVVGRPWRKAIRTRPSASGEAPPLDGMPYADFVENRLRDLVDTARSSEGVRAGSPEQLALPDAVRREPAWLPLGLIAAAVVVLVVTLVV